MSFPYIKSYMYIYIYIFMLDIVPIYQGMQCFEPVSTIRPERYSLSTKSWSLKPTLRTLYPTLSDRPFLETFYRLLR